MDGSEEKSEPVAVLMKIVGAGLPEQPLIPKVPFTLRQVRTNDFIPKVVSLGPYHNRKGRTKPMDCLKEDAVRWFVSLWPCSDGKVKKIYEDFVKESRDKPLRDLYETIKHLDEDFMLMMFVDGCFILYHVYLVVKGLHHDERYIHIHQPSILSDMFLLENQIPYAVLKSLLSLMPDLKEEDMKGQKEEDIKAEAGLKKKFPCAVLKSLLNLMPDSKEEDIIGQKEEDIEAEAGLKKKITAVMEEDIEKFIEHFLHEHAFLDTSSNDKKPETKSTCVRNDKEPLHLLEILRTKLIGDIGDPIIPDPKDPIPEPKPNDRYYFGSIMELKAKGIKIRKSTSNYLGRIGFEEGRIHGYLSLPRMIIDDGTRPLLLNLIACEMCPGFASHRVITSYVCFLDSLIDHAEDVKELRSKGILVNRLGTDKEVAILFNEMTCNLMADYHTVYADTMWKIKGHCDAPKTVAKLKGWFDEMLRTYFRSPWTVISLVAGFLLLFITAVQTYFTVW